MGGGLIVDCSDDSHTKPSNDNASCHSGSETPVTRPSSESQFRERHPEVQFCSRVSGKLRFSVKVLSSESVCPEDLQTLQHSPCPLVHISQCTSWHSPPFPISTITLHFVISNNNYNLAVCLWLLSGCILECSGNPREEGGKEKKTTQILVPAQMEVTHIYSNPACLCLCGLLFVWSVRPPPPSTPQITVLP